RPDGKLDVGGAVGREGEIRVVRSHAPYVDPYTTSLALTSGEVGEAVATYLGVSEQIPSAILLGVQFTDGHVVAPGGVLMQARPGRCPKRLRGMAVRVRGSRRRPAAMRRARRMQVESDELRGRGCNQPVTVRPIEGRFECRCTDRRPLEAM